jgi:hypothetical protein
MDRKRSGSHLLFPAAQMPQLRPPAGNIVGTSVLQNATLETYNQGKDTTLAAPDPINGGVFTCLTCHTSNGFGVSHDFSHLQPLTKFTSNPGYMLGSFPTNLFVDLGLFQQGTFVTIQTSVVPFNGFSGNVALSVGALPQGVNAFFSRNQTTSTSTLTLTVSPQALPGVSNVEILSSSGNLTSSSLLSLTVIAPSFNLGASANSLTIHRNSSDTSAITIYPVDGFSGVVTLATSNLPAGVTASFSPNPATSSSLLTLTADATAKVGRARVAITGTSGNLTTSTALCLTVVGPNN